MMMRKEKRIIRRWVHTGVKKEPGVITPEAWSMAGIIEDKEKTTITAKRETTIFHAYITGSTPFKIYNNIIILSLSLFLSTPCEKPIIISSFDLSSII